GRRRRPAAAAVRAARGPRRGHRPLAAPGPAGGAGARPCGQPAVRPLLTGAAVADRADQAIAVLFDMDGTLVDSEKVWDVGLRELSTRYGGELSAAARASMVGTSMAESMAILHADLGQP